MVESRSSNYFEEDFGGLKFAPEAEEVEKKSRKKRNIPKNKAKVAKKDRALKVLDSPSGSGSGSPVSIGRVPVKFAQAPAASFRQNLILDDDSESSANQII